MTVEYRDETPFTNDLHTLQQIADALRHKKFGKDAREAIAQAVEKLYGIGPNTVVSGSPAGAYATLSDLQSAYPNGQQGVFVVAETGKWYIWNPRENRWDEGGNFQSPMSQSEVEDGRVWGDGTKSASIGTAIRGQVLKEKIERIQNVEQEKTERIKSDEQLQGQINLYSTALEAKEVRLRDSQNNLLWNGNKYVTGNVYLPRTDKTGLADGLPVDSSIIGYTFLGHLEEYGLPILKLESPDLLNLTSKAQGKLKGVKFDYDPNGFDGRTTHETGTLKSIKIQGNSSAYYPKKNYTLGFDDDVRFKTSWGNHHKYVIKADWVDFSHMRNEFAAHLWGLIRKTRITTDNVLVDNEGNQLVRTSVTTLGGDITPQFAGPNYGAIEGFPILVLINDVYWGLYSLTVPKDDWMVSMSGEGRQALISAGYMNQFDSLVKGNEKGELSDSRFEIEYISNEDDQTWLVDSLNKLTSAIMNSTNDLFNDDSIDIDSAVDYYILNVLLANYDGISHNFTLQTWNGKKWYLGAYDLDGTFGMKWNGYEAIRADDFDFKNHTRNLLFKRIYENREVLKNRWTYLRQNVISDITLSNLSYEWALKINKAVFDYEVKRWPMRPGTNVSNISQIQTWLKLRTEFLDNQIKNL